jgi:hypothetical protein
MAISTRVNGRPTVIAAACNAPSASAPPPNSSAPAITPSITAQNTRCGVGASTLPPAVMLSITSEPESDEVMKNTSTSTIARNEVMPAIGKFSSIWNIASETSLIPPASAPTLFAACSSAVPPKADIHTTVTRVGTSSTATRNWRTVRPFEMRAMNMPTKGDQEIQQAQ